MERHYKLISARTFQELERMRNDASRIAWTSVAALGLVVFVGVRTFSLLLGIVSYFAFYSMDVLTKRIDSFYETPCFLDTIRSTDSNAGGHCWICLDDAMTNFYVRCGTCTFVSCLRCMNNVQGHTCPQCRTEVYRME